MYVCVYEKNRLGERLNEEEKKKINHRVLERVEAVEKCGVGVTLKGKTVYVKGYRDFAKRGCAR